MKRILQLTENEATRRRMVILLAVFVIAMLASAFAAEAAVKDTIRGGWTSLKSGFGSIKGWWQSAKLYMNVKMFVNFFILFALLFVLQMIFLKEFTQDEKQKYAIWALCLIGAIIIGVQLVPQGNQYLWEQGSTRDIARFFFGKPPSETLPPGCSGDGAYAKILPGNRGVTCRQALLRIGEAGKGLPAFIITFLVLYAIFSIYKGQLGMGEGGASKLVYILPAYLAALIANQGATKNQIVVMGGWVLVIVIYGKIKSSMGEKGNPGLAMGLSFAFVQIIANLLGASLLGGLFEPVEPQGITIWWVLSYIAIGFGISFLYNTFTKKGGVLEQYFQKLDDHQKERVEQLTKSGDWGRALVQSMPLFGLLDWTKKVPPPKVENVKNCRDELKKIVEKYAATGQPISEEDNRRIAALTQLIRLEEEQTLNSLDAAIKHIQDQGYGVQLYSPGARPIAQQQAARPVQVPPLRAPPATAPQAQQASGEAPAEQEE